VEGVPARLVPGVGIFFRRRPWALTYGPFVLKHLGIKTFPLICVAAAAT
jgi:hypothetical protein